MFFKEKIDKVRQMTSHEVKPVIYESKVTENRFTFFSKCTDEDIKNIV